ncbi:hypothetical protein BC835DRAFT_1536643 [Cytidiella melzeri]|nr:hypothetical protein BC835DRAFT_1536643 [Cytidiella melzeri]
MAQQRLVLSIIDFLNQSIKDGTVKQDDHESLEVAIQCIGEAFGVDPSDETQRGSLSVKPFTLPSIFDVFLKTYNKHDPPAAAPSSSSAPTSQPQGPSEADKAAAEKLKAAGNAEMSGKQYDAAIQSYTKAIALDPTNAVYYSNRAAAHSSKNDHASAVADAETAIQIDPGFVRAYHRLGQVHAHYCSNDFKAAADAFQRGLDIDPTNANLKTGLQSAQARIPQEDEDANDDAPDVGSATAAGGTGAGLGGMADLLRGLGGGGAGGGPDLASMMNNPAIMQMAQQMMANGGLERLMSNPALANMMNRVQSGGGMPSMADLMSDPALRNIASQFGGGVAPQ